MTFKRLGEKYFLRFNYKENFVAELLTFCAAEKINLANLDGIGSFLNCELAYFDVASKKYQSKSFDSTHEVLGVLGTITRKEGKPYLHAHVTLSDENYAAKGGHLNQATVGATLEIVLEKENGAIDRKFDDEIGLNLMQF